MMGGLGFGDLSKNIEYGSKFRPVVSNDYKDDADFEKTLDLMMEGNQVSNNL